MFSTPADLGIVAYALVRPSNGPGGVGVGDTSELNSGVTANWSGTGVCDITLPGDPTQQEPLQLGQGGPSGVPCRDLILITPCYTGQPVYYCVNDISPFDKRVFFYDYAGSLASVSFTIIILRSLISPPQDAQGNYLAPA
jgi:hypothetical protein